MIYYEVHGEFLRCECRQYAILLSYFHYCQGMVNRDFPLSVMRTLLVGAGDEDMEVEKV